MRLVLLPGLNGSSALFAPLLAELGDIECQAIELPEHGPQDYDALAQKMAQRLGNAPFVLLGESFSGPIAYRLAMRKSPGLRGMVFAASFLTAPSAALPLLKCLPISLRLTTQPWLLRAMCLGQNASDRILRLIQEEIRGLDKALIHARLHTLATLRAPQQRLDLPALHLWPQQDRLVAHKVARQLAHACSDIRQLCLEGPHFILQTQPRRCAQAIRGFMQELENRRVTSPAFP
ncbi:alpha/beta hydrolase [Ectopseudomonas mendocina]|uniref:Alpha/beta hydrolase n=1 Tax=Ectopseudomonas mendocina TaxID=300 RepID=A0ABD7RTW9_ECTME|nr:alpha/beta hydrolase [Pseudomonas mendocina]TRO11503.1 alpha/beta hydrolase [Pseudomonas mendocina]TRO16651.1 alpha/beta hydrolase [Pseudomonas mendocina]